MSSLELWLSLICNTIDLVDLVHYPNNPDKLVVNKKLVSHNLHLIFNLLNSVSN